MPDLDRTTLLNEATIKAQLRKAFQEAFHSVQGRTYRDAGLGEGQKALDDIVEYALWPVVRPLLPAPSEAPAEAFTSDNVFSIITAVLKEWSRRYPEIQFTHPQGYELASTLRDAVINARLVRERHTWKVGKGQEVNVMRGELSGPNEVIVLSPLTIAQLRELDSLTPRQVQALCNSHEALRHTGKG